MLQTNTIETSNEENLLEEFLYKLSATDDSQGGDRSGSGFENGELEFYPVNFDNRAHIDPLVEFLALHGESGWQEIFRRMTPANDLEDTRVIVTELVKFNSKILGALSLEYLKDFPCPEVELTLIQAIDLDSKEKGAIAKSVIQHVQNLSGRQSWGRVVVSVNSEVLKLLKGSLSDDITIEKSA